MNLKNIGNFIAERRKSKKLTQLELANKIFVSEKTISKWECGKGFPESSLILPLCKELDISANELLSGKLLTSEDYKKCAEENLIILKNRQENSVKHLLTLEWVVALISLATYLVSFIYAMIFVDEIVWKILLIVFGVIVLLIGVAFAIRIEQIAGFYECKNCGHRYIPKYSSVFFAMHSGRTRYLKCPNCGKRTWNKKVISEK